MNKKLLLESTETFWTYPPKLERGKNINGYVQMVFGQTRSSWATSEPYILNSYNDGWLRKTAGIAKGYGLAIRQIKLNAKQFETGFFNVYKVTIKYLPYEFDDPDDDHSGNWETGKMQLWVYFEFDAKDVIKYIESRIKTYIP